MLLCFCFAIIYAVQSSIGVCINPLFSPYGYKPFVISVGAILCLTIGLAASVIASVFLDKTKKYLITLKICCIITTLVFLSSLWVVPLDNNILALSMLILSGIAMVPVTPLGFAFSIELTHPTQPVLVNGFLLMCAQTMSFVMGVTITELALRSPPIAFMTYTGLCALTVIASMLMKQELRL